MIKLNRFFLVIIMFVLTLSCMSLEAQQLFPVQNSEGKFGFINPRGEVVIKAVYDSAFYFSEGYCCIREGNQWGYIDSLGKMIIQPQFDSAYTFSEGLALVFQDSMAGYIGVDGKYIIEPKYFDGMSFSDGMALVKYEEDKWGFIDNQGKLRIKEFQIDEFTIHEYGPENIYYCLPFFRSGLVSYNPYHHIFLDKKGRKYKYKKYNISRFSDGVAIANDAQDRKSFYINKKGKRIISDTYSAISRFIDGHAWVLSCEDSTNSVFYYIDKQGEKVDSVVIDLYCQHTSLFNIGNGVACTYNYRNADLRGLIIFNLRGDSINVRKLPFYTPDIHSDIRLQNTLFLTYIEIEKVYINIKGDIVSKYLIQ